MSWYHVRLSLRNWLMDRVPLWAKLLWRRIFGEAMARRAERHLRATGINDDYCWVHNGTDMGGWRCQHPECKSK